MTTAQNDATSTAPRAHVLTNPRAVSACAAAWCVALGVLYWYCGGTHADNGYILWSFGPSAELRFIGLTIDTWDKWSAFNALIFVDTVVTVWVAETALTWLTFEVYDRDKHEVRWGAQTLTTAQTVAVALMYNFYITIHAWIWLYVALTAADTLLLIVLTSLVATGVMVLVYLRDKHHNASVAAAATAATAVTAWQAKAVPGTSKSHVKPVVALVPPRKLRRAPDGKGQPYAPVNQ